MNVINEESKLSSHQDDDLMSPRDDLSCSDSSRASSQAEEENHTNTNEPDIVMLQMITDG